VREVRRGGLIQICFRCPIGRFLLSTSRTSVHGPQYSRFLRIHTARPFDLLVAALHSSLHCECDVVAAGRRTIGTVYSVFRPEQ
jgi:hypothetical protein